MSLDHYKDITKRNGKKKVWGHCYFCGAKITIKIEKYPNTNKLLYNTLSLNFNCPFEHDKKIEKAFELVRQVEMKRWN